MILTYNKKQKRNILFLYITFLKNKNEHKTTFFFSACS